MKIFKIEKVKSLLLINILIFTLAVIVLITTTLIQFNSYEKNVNLALAGTIDIIKKQYPLVDETDIIKYFDNQKLSEVKTNELSKYGIDIKNVEVLKSFEESKRTIIINNIIIIFVLGTLSLLTFILYLIYEKKKINNLTNYITEINNKNYSLKLTDNIEGMFSKLENELYKITVMLREEADNSKKEHTSLMNSVLDISHQIKTPLTSIKIMLDNLKNIENMDLETRKDFINDISKQIDSISFLVISMLKLAKFDAGIIIFKENEINLNHLVDEVIKDLSVLMDVSGVKVSSLVDKDLKVTGDFNWQKEAITNIVKNCIEHTAPGKGIIISSVTNAVYTKLVIKDEGTGIDKTDLKNIFKRFYKGKNSKDDSIGIGLALSKSIIEKGNGYISVNSVLNEGTTFEIKYLKR